ncbi:MAG: hypothetical protein EAZ08_14035 [Cytophagales bacterium]|nr:MAG: hypothetical protein EAZ08_14035 [Cytophagales bacterium]
MEHHSFFNEEIKPALTVINIVLGLFVPATLFFGLLALVIKPMQIYATGWENLAQNVVWMIAGVGFPSLTIWSIFQTWTNYKKKEYRKAFYISISPIIFTCGLMVLFALIYVIDTFVMFFE